MINFIYCKKEISDNTNHEFKRTLENLKSKFTLEDAIQLLEKAVDKYIYKGSDLRFYFVVHSISIDGRGDFKFLYLYKYIKRNENNYHILTQNAVNQVVNISPEELSEIKSDILSKLPEDKLSKLNDTDYLFFERLQHFYDFDILESSLWINEVNTEYFGHNWLQIKDAIRELITNDEEASENYISEEAYNIKVFKFGNQDIYYDYYKHNSKNYYVLHSFYVSDKVKFAEEIKKVYSKVNLDTPLEERLRIIGRRAYLNNIFLEDDKEFNKDQWIKLELDQESNLALSKEEEEILQKQELPLFINGQAGSGKSTILYYLLAEYIYKFIDTDKFNEILFLTYSEHLNKKAYNNVINILLTNQNFENKKELIQNSKKQIKNCFYPFKDFIREKILKTKNEFNIEKEITFIRFRNWYNATDNEKYQSNFCLLPSKRNYSAELVWFIIRTFIKGYLPKGYLTPEDYKNIPAKDRIIIYEIYEDIYNTIWQKWYKPLLNNYWDDQDLVKAGIEALHRNNEKHNLFSIIICDESQDFTRAEINFIINLFKYLKYDLFGVDITPIAFAGDPYQSINPTGFSFDRLKESFYSEFEKYNFKIPLNTNELTINFRSIEQIVNLANFVQLLRRSLLNINGLKPQKFVKHGDISNTPIFWELGKKINLEQIKELDWDIILVPDDIFHEINNDEYLKTFVKNDKVTNIFKVFDFKGDERENIFLYKFGHYFINNLNIDFEDCLQKRTILDENLEYKLKNFFNILYVAITRAKSNLRIIDTAEAYEKFWSKFNISLAEQIIANVDDEDWLEFVYDLKSNPLYKQLIEKDNTFSIKNKSNKEKLEMAESFFQKGKDEKNIDYLQRAIESFHRLGDTNREKVALSFYYEFTFQYNDAANICVEIGEIERAIKLYWKGKNWDKINEITTNSKNEKHVIIKKIINRIILNESNEIFDVVDDWINSINFIEFDWTVINDKLYRYCINNATSIFKDNPNKVRAAIKKLMEYFCDDRYYKVLGIYYYNEHRFEEAVNAWENFPDFNEYKNEYFIAKGNIAQKPDDKIEFYSKADNNHDLILKVYESEKMGDKKFSISSLDKVSDCYKYIKSYDKYLNLNFLIIQKYVEQENHLEWRNRVRDIISFLSTLNYDSIKNIEKEIVIKYFRLVNDYSLLIFTNFFYKLLLVLTDDKKYVAELYYQINKELLSQIQFDSDTEDVKEPITDYKNNSISGRLEFFVMAITNPYEFYLNSLFERFTYSKAEFTFHRLRNITYELVDEPFIAYLEKFKKNEGENSGYPKIDKEYIKSIINDLEAIVKLINKENLKEIVEWDVIKNYETLSSCFYLIVNQVFGIKEVYNFLSEIRNLKINPNLESLNSLFKKINEFNKKLNKDDNFEFKAKFDKLFMPFLLRNNLYLKDGIITEKKKNNNLGYKIKFFANSLLSGPKINEITKYLKLNDEDILINYLYLVKLFEFTKKYVSNRIADLLDLYHNDKYKLINYYFENSYNNLFKNININIFEKYIKEDEDKRRLKIKFSEYNRAPLIQYKQLLNLLKSIDESKLENINDSEDSIPFSQLKELKHALKLVRQEIERFNSAIDFTIKNIDDDFKEDLIDIFEIYPAYEDLEGENYEEENTKRQVNIELKVNATEKAEGLHLFYKNDRKSVFKIKSAEDENSEFVNIDTNTLQVSTYESDEIVKEDDGAYFIKYLNAKIKMLDGQNYFIEKGDIIINVKLVQ